MDSVGWGIIGIGNIVKGTMAPAIVAEDNMHLVAGVSRDLRRAEAFAEEFGAPYAYSDYYEMLANPEVDAVFIATPNSQHADQVVRAAEAGKHVLCDKPLATTVEDAVRAFRACREAGVSLGINFHNRRLDWVNDTRAMLADGAIGRVAKVQVEASAGLRPPVSWRNDRELSGMGTVYNQGVHVFDFLRFILDAEPVAVFAMLDDEGIYEVETQALILMEMSNGTQAFLDINANSPYPRNDIAFYGTEGRISGVGLTRSRFDGELSVITANGTTTTAYPQPSGQAHRRNIAAFSDAVLTGTEPNASGVDGLHSMVLCDAIARSAAERRLVEVDRTPVEDALA